MSKIDVNNEIVSMRQTVRRARLHVVRKLIKQVKMLGAKKGDDKQREKYKRKADKLGQELVAIKKIRDDEISRYSITNTRNLGEVLTEQKSDPETCVLARLSSHKIVADRVAEFKAKFPNFEQHLGPGRRKLIKLKRKAGKQAKKEAKITAQASEQEKTENDDLDERRSGDNDSEESGEEIDQSLIQKEENYENPELELPEKATSFSENEERKPPTKCLPELEPRKIKLRKTVDKLDKLSGITSTNKEAAVKSFARFLEEKDEASAETESPENKGLKTDSEIVLEKEVDSFFMTEDGGGEYLSVVVPKSNITDDEGGEDNAEDSRSFRSRNNRFFDKVDNKVDKRKHSDNRDNASFSRVGNRFKDRNETRDRRNNVGQEVKNRGDFRSSEKTTNENMHPSWAAKKKQQEILKLGFQGKKIVFDDAS